MVKLLCRKGRFLCFIGFLDQLQQFHVSDPDYANEAMLEKLIMVIVIVIIDIIQDCS